MKEKKYSVYVHINKNENAKCYVGISTNPKKRWGKNGIGYKTQPKFYYAIEKYGWDNFKHIILCKNLTVEEAYEKEKYYIKTYDSINDGYNIHEGGKVELTQAMREKGYISRTLKESPVYIYSKKTDKEIVYETVTEASLKTGISEHWFYRYYRHEVDDLFDFVIFFGGDKKIKNRNKEEKIEPYNGETFDLLEYLKNH